MLGVGYRNVGNSVHIPAFLAFDWEWSCTIVARCAWDQDFTTEKMARHHNSPSRCHRVVATGTSPILGWLVNLWISMGTLSLVHPHTSQKQEEIVVVTHSLHSTLLLPQSYNRELFV